MQPRFYILISLNLYCRRTPDFATYLSIKCNKPPLRSNKKPKEVNRWQIFNVGTTQEGLVDRKEEEEGEKEDQGPAIPWYNPSMDPVINIICVLDLNFFLRRAKEC